MHGDGDFSSFALVILLLCFLLASVTSLLFTALFASMIVHPQPGNNTRRSLNCRDHWTQGAGVIDGKLCNV